jgi:hypothetical protein
VLKGLKMENVVEALVSFLRDMFKAGAHVLERKIVEELCASFGINPGEVRGADLATLIKRILPEK